VVVYVVVDIFVNEMMIIFVKCFDRNV